MPKENTSTLRFTREQCKAQFEYHYRMALVFEDLLGLDMLDRPDTFKLKVERSGDVEDIRYMNAENALKAEMSEHMREIWDIIPLSAQQEWVNAVVNGEASGVAYQRFEEMHKNLD